MEEIKQESITEEKDKEIEVPATPEEIKTNEELLKANAQISELRQQLQEAQVKLQEKEAIAKEQAFDSLLTKYKVKPEFHKFVKFELKWEELSDLDKSLTEFIKNNPALVETVTTGGTEETIKTDGEPETNTNPLLQYKKENFL